MWSGPSLTARASRTLGWVYGEIYNLEAAIRYNREGTEASYTVGDPEIIRNAEINLGDDYLLVGDLEQAQRYLEKVYTDTQQRGKWGEEVDEVALLAASLSQPGRAVAHQGGRSPGAGVRRRMPEAGRADHEPQESGQGLALKGQALLAQGQGEEAEAVLSRALTIAREIGNPPQLWKTYQALGALYESQADLERARVAYQSAMDVIDGMTEPLQGQELQRTFLAARPVQEIRERPSPSQQREAMR